MASGFLYFMLFGGSRSGKTFLIVRTIVIRALKAKGSRHAILRYRFNAVKVAIAYDTFPKVMRLCFPDIEWKLDKTDWFVQLPNGSQIWFGGLDDKERTEKILGQEYASIFLNECSQIAWASVGIVITRLAQNCYQDDDVPLALRMYFDCNPPDKLHWSYLVFVKGLDPLTKSPLVDYNLYAKIQMNPEHNQQNLPSTYIHMLKGQSAALQRRFLFGEFKDANPNALFPEIHLDQWRVDDSSSLPDFVRVVVAVDPSGADDDDNEDNDEIGIYVVALGTDGVAYVLEDCTLKAGPAIWGKAAVSAYRRHEADVIVGEQNFGGAMVKFVIQATDSNVKYDIVNASRGKQQRAEPFSPLFADGRVRIVGRHDKMEDELSGFSTHGYTGADSPNRADAMFWALAKLFPGIVGSKKAKEVKVTLMPTRNSWNR